MPQKGPEARVTESWVGNQMALGCSELMALAEAGQPGLGLLSRVRPLLGALLSKPGLSWAALGGEAQVLIPGLRLRLRGA